MNIETVTEAEYYGYKKECSDAGFDFWRQNGVRNTRIQRMIYNFKLDRLRDEGWSPKTWISTISTRTAFSIEKSMITIEKASITTPSLEMLIKVVGRTATNVTIERSMITATATLTTCPMGHELKAFMTTTSSYECDKCKKKLTGKTQMHGCETCTYNICADCFENSMVTAAATLKTTPPTTTITAVICSKDRERVGFMTTTFSLECDKCKKKLKRKTKMHGCEICNWNLCTFCFGRTHTPFTIEMSRCSDCRGRIDTPSKYLQAKFTTGICKC